MFRKSRSLLPHEAFLLDCATPLSDQRTRDAVGAALAVPSLDWPAAARMSLRHGVASCVAFHLQDLGATSAIPEAAAACFQRLYCANGARNTILYRECSRLLNAFAAAGIPYLVLKGAALSLTAYPDPALRNFADIDLLVNPHHYAAAGEAAEACGFICEFPEKDPYCVHQPYAFSCPEDILTATLPLEFEQEISPAVVAANRHRVLVEIHRALFHDANGMAWEADPAALWEDARISYFPDGTPFSYPATEVMLFHLAAHAADHNFGRLMYFMDIATEVRHEGDRIEWDRVVRLAETNRVTGHVYRSLELAQRAFGAAVPREALDKLADLQGAPAACRPLTLPDVLAAPLQNRHAVFLHRLRLSPNRQRLFHSMLTTVAPPPVMMRRIYGVRHPLLIAALYLLRPLILLARLIGYAIYRRPKN